MDNLPAHDVISLTPDTCDNYLRPPRTCPHDAALLSSCSDMRSVESWLDKVFAARGGHLRQRPARASATALSPSSTPTSTSVLSSTSVSSALLSTSARSISSSTTPASTSLSTPAPSRPSTAPRTRRQMPPRSRQPTNPPLTRSKSRRPQTSDCDERVEASVAALRIADACDAVATSQIINNHETIDTTHVVNNHNIIDTTRIMAPTQLDLIAQRPSLASLPQSSSAHSWISADTQSQASWSTQTPADTDSVVTKTTATSRSSKRGHGRSKSPVKSMVDLALLDRKVERVHLAIKDYPDTIRHLMHSVRDIQRAKGIMPHEIKSTLEERDDVEAEEWWWNTTLSDLSKGKLLVELEIMDEILCETHRQHDESAAEPGWNDKVHSLMLRQVCMHLPGIEYQNITTARPDPHLVPKTGLTHTESKLVDYALICDKTLIPPHLIERILADTSNGIDSINHTRDSVQSLRRNPIAVSFETKTPNGSESEALTQLSLWAATHFNRLRTLLPLSSRDVVTMPLPLVMAVGGRYSLFFAIDGSIGQGIRIVGGETAFGDCASLEGCYQVLAGLRIVGEWVREMWVPWFVSDCLGE